MWQTGQTKIDKQENVNKQDGFPLQVEQTGRSMFPPTKLISILLA